ncbi:CocE/NonD family hydrolase [Nocardia iowensis]|uniref:CocE/NonD family hydrolase n=1 Tax=Nocardia iowensis TaxID=204891 RepID=A0ABX8RJ80_NOCIO|nr:CocE/NonD family hydrolase [Nocardia iowensis]QXN88937.1 CocE/NonD family hydrolase [Nocardia iowensis]
MALPLSSTAVPVPPNHRFDIGPARYPKLFGANTVPIPMSDGAVLTADILRPGDGAGPAREPLPAIINFTPYNKMFSRRGMRWNNPLRALGERVGSSDRQRFTARDVLHTPAGGILEPFAINRTAVRRGYVGLMIDVRGTGSSTGSWDFFQPREQQDYLEAIAWVREQPWCNGEFAVTGVSYGAISALITAGLRPQGLRAVFAIEAGEDPMRELGLTGGVPTPGMLLWILAVNGFKWLPSLPGLLRAGITEQFLRDRIADPASWVRHAIEIGLTEQHPDGFLNPMWAGKLARFENITAPTWIHGGWHDVYNRSNFRMFDRIPLSGGAKQVLVDDSYHLTIGSGFGASDSPQAIDELQCAWFDRWVKDIDNGIDGYGPITVRRQGDGRWLRHPVFPDPVATLQRFYLNAETSGAAAHAGTDAGLAPEATEVASRLPLPPGRISMASNNTGVLSMGVALLFGRRFGTDDRRAEAGAITFTSAPFTEDTVVSGPMNLHLNVEVEGTDAFWSVTVCDVEPGGASVPITRGALLSSLRAIDTEGSEYVDGELVFALHTLTAESVLPVVPGEPFVIDIEINPTEALLRTGHRLRVAVSRNSFPRHFIAPWRQRMIGGQAIALDPERPSYLTLRARRAVLSR